VRLQRGGELGHDVLVVGIGGLSRLGRRGRRRCRLGRLVVHAGVGHVGQRDGLGLPGAALRHSVRVQREDDGLEPCERLPGDGAGHVHARECRHKAQHGELERRDAGLEGAVEPAAERVVPCA
jgi:hypothetical protein